MLRRARKRGPGAGPLRGVGPELGGAAEGEAAGGEEVFGCGADGAERTGGSAAAAGGEGKRPGRGGGKAGGGAGGGGGANAGGEAGRAGGRRRRPGCRRHDPLERCPSP